MRQDEKKEKVPTDKNTIDEAWWGGYVPANMAFARTVAAKARGQMKPVMMLHDYHLYLAPGSHA